MYWLELGEWIAGMLLMFSVLSICRRERRTMIECCDAMVARGRGMGTGVGGKRAETGKKEATTVGARWPPARLAFRHLGHV